MSSYQIKLIAVICMAVDHVGLFFYPDILILRVIGRLSFPLFAWLIVNGIEYSKDKKAYFIRLFVFALLSQIPYILAFGEINPSFWQLNIFFTLSFGFLGVSVIQYIKNKFISVSLLLLILLSAYFLQVSYSFGGVLSILGFYFYRNNYLKMFISQFLIYSLCYTIPAFFTPVNGSNLVAIVQPLGVVAVCFISQYNKQEGPKLKYFFYLFYPLHLLIIYLLLRTE